MISCEFKINFVLTFRCFFFSSDLADDGGQTLAIVRCLELFWNRILHLMNLKNFIISVMK